MLRAVGRRGAATSTKDVGTSMIHHANAANVGGKKFQPWWKKLQLSGTYAASSGRRTGDANGARGRTHGGGCVMVTAGDVRAGGAGAPGVRVVGKKKWGQTIGKSTPVTHNSLGVLPSASTRTIEQPQGPGSSGATAANVSH